MNANSGWQEHGVFKLLERRGAKQHAREDRPKLLPPPPPPMAAPHLGWVPPARHPGPPPAAGRMARRRTWLWTSGSKGFDDGTRPARSWAAERMLIAPEMPQTDPRGI